MTDPPRSRLTLAVRRDVLVDRTAYRLLASRAKRPELDEVARISGEVDDALALFEAKGWLAEPASYHRAPPPPTEVRTRPTQSGGVRYASLTWDDGYECWPDEPGAERFASYPRNRIARAAVLEHRSGDRPWLVCLHGFGMGNPRTDLRAFRALHLFRDVGLNLAFLTLPFHGRRNPGRGFPQVPGPDMLDNIHGLAQGVWDARQLLQLVRARTERPVGIMGLSLGGCVTALTASVDDVDAAVLLIPVADLGALVMDAAQGDERTPAEFAELPVRARRLMDVVSPLALTPRVPPDRRFLVGGTLDQFVRPSTQSAVLARHWDIPEPHWYHGGHVSMFWARGVQAAIDDALRASLHPTSRK